MNADVVTPTSTHVSSDGFRTVPLTSLHEDSHNARKHDVANLAAIRVSLREFGQVEPLVVQKSTGMVIGGNGRLREMRVMGWTECKVYEVDLDDRRAAALAIALNHAGELAEWDQEKLDEAISVMQVDDDELRQLLSDLDSGKASLKAQPEDEDGLFQKEFSVLVRCANEPDQKAVLEELDRHGLDLRALVVDYPVKEKKEPEPGPELPPGGVEIVRACEIRRTARVMQLEGLFDVPPSKQAEQRWRVKIQLDRPWSIGLIVGASGSGKTTIARELFGPHMVSSWPWSEDAAIVDDFPQDLGIAEITGLLSSVGFSSPPSWLKPFHVLSNGEQFRVTLARTLAEKPNLAVVDEFTSVVDRTVAQIGSAALAKAVRATGTKFIAVSCHHDIEEWLQPDWKIEMPVGELVWRLLRRRPEIQLQVRRVNSGKWPLFRSHHYLNHGIHESQCFMATANGRPAVFTAVCHNPNQFGGFYREHRTVCLPDFQGVGIGNAMSDLVAGAFSTLKSYHSTTSHPAMIRHRLRSSLWRSICKLKFQSAHHGKGKSSRYTASFEYVGPERPDEAALLGIGQDG